MDSEELLAQLADIHLPEAVSYWPPAPGWWVLALILLIAVVVLTNKYIKYRDQQRICQHALAELERCLQTYAENNQQDKDAARLSYVNEVNSVLRRVALVHFPQANVASLSGAAWVDFVREKGESSYLDDDIAAALSHGRFQTRCDVDTEKLYMLGKAWISSLYLNEKSERNERIESNKSEAEPSPQGASQ